MRSQPPHERRGCLLNGHRAPSRETTCFPHTLPRSSATIRYHSILPGPRGRSSGARSGGASARLSRSQSASTRPPPPGSPEQPSPPPVRPERPTSVPLPFGPLLNYSFAEWFLTSLL